MPYKRLIFQIYITFLIITLLSLSAITWYSGDLARHFYLEETTKNLENSAQLIKKQILSAILDNRIDSLNTDLTKLDLLTDMRITVILPNGLVIADTRENPENMDNHSKRPEVIEALAGQTASSLRFSHTIGKKLMYVALPIRHKGTIIGVARTSIPIEAIDNTLSSIMNQFILAGIFLVLLTALVGWLISRRISAPYEEVSRGIERIARGDLDFRLKPAKSKFMDVMIDNMNEMISQLDDKIKTIDHKSSEQQAVLQSMAEGVIAIDKNKHIITINNAAHKLLGLDTDEVQGKKIKEIVKYKELRRIITHAIKTNELIEDEIIIPPDDRYVQLHGTVLKNEVDETIGALIVLNDVTRLRRLEVVRRDFVANVSHEIRTPLTSIKGFIETLLDGASEEPETSKRFLKIMMKQANRLNSIIEDLLALADLEESEKRESVQFTKSNIRKVVDSAISICSPRAQDKNISLNTDCNENLNIIMNPTLVEQALVNLIDNAVKYSSEGTRVVIQCEITPKNCEISVRDQGIGIKQEHLPRIFERFYRVDKARSRTLGGTGLGLAIVKHIAKVHNGAVSVESKVGEGSSFILSIPR
ncbi:MAG: ATP-binding protein [Calditrichaceae bacterium]